MVKQEQPKVGPDGKYMVNNHIVSFIGFAPADDPEIIVYVAIDNPKNTIQFGGLVTGPIVGTIIEDSLRNLNIPQRENEISKEYMWPEEPKEMVPDLVGLNKSEIVNDYSVFSVEVHGEGEYIIDQSPKAGIKLAPGSTIRIYLSEAH